MLYFFPNHLFISTLSALYDTITAYIVCFSIVYILNRSAYLPQSSCSSFVAFVDSIPIVTLLFSFACFQVFCFSFISVIPSYSSTLLSSVSWNWNSCRVTHLLALWLATLHCFSVALCGWLPHFALVSYLLFLLFFRAFASLVLLSAKRYFSNYILLLIEVKQHLKTCTCIYKRILCIQLNSIIKPFLRALILVFCSFFFNVFSACITIVVCSFLSWSAISFRSSIFIRVRLTYFIFNSPPYPFLSFVSSCPLFPLSPFHNKRVCLLA